MCKTCANAIFDPVYGEYKCSVDEHRVYGELVYCGKYKEGKPIESKDAKDYYEQIGVYANVSNE